MQLNKYQQAIQEIQLTTNSSIAVSAGPGTGKSTTLVEIAKLVPWGKKAMFMAFNKSIVNTLKERLPKHVECSTMHSVGFKSIIKHFQKAGLNDNLQQKFIMPFFDKSNPKEKWVNVYEIDRLMKLARATMTETTKEGFEKLIEDHALDVKEENISIGIKALKKFYEHCENLENYGIEVDYQMMVELPVLRPDIIVPKFDYLLTDECQDFSNLDRKFLARLVKPMGGRKISVGDKKQSIYGFRGSAPDSFDQFSNEKNTVTLPLSICYRCSKTIVREAKTIYDDIEENPDGEEGLPINRKGKVSDIREGDFVICRNNRPLIDCFFQLLKLNKKAYVAGKDTEKGLLAILADFDSGETINELTYKKLEGYLESVKNTLIAKGKTNYKVHPKYGIAEEKVEIIKVIFEKFKTIREVENFIETIFDDDEREGIKLSTIHKIKGQEADRVFIIEKYAGKDLIPSQYAITKDQLTQEKNLKFVAYTRSRKELIFLQL